MVIGARHCIHEHGSLAVHHKCPLVSTPAGPCFQLLSTHWSEAASRVALDVAGAHRLRIFVAGGQHRQ
jgi:hypothetical protein